MAAREAGAAILRYYPHRSVLRLKHDDSPLTLADQEAHQVIEAHLAESGLLVVSEEGGSLHLNAQRYWLVDPLDGTKDFLAGNDEFTVNIALVDQGRPLLGVVFAPAIAALYWGVKGIGAQRIQEGAETPITTHARSDFLRMAVSRFHNHPHEDIFATQNRVKERVAIGSALKYCSLAAGEIDVFPRLVGSSEWDTAAGQAVLEAAGGHLLDWHSDKPLWYGKPARRNPRLLAFRAPYQRDEFKLTKYESEIL